MSFAADAIGFYLQLENTLSPELARAEKDYERFVKSLDKFNKLAYARASKGVAGLASLIESFEMLPKKAVASYTKAVQTIRKKIKPLTQPVVLRLGAKAERSLASSISAAVARVLRRVKIRMTTAAPLKRSPLFDTSKALRQTYKGQPQPPDMLGRFQNIPRYQKGGVVPGPGGIDEILAMLTPGEMVLPKDIVSQLQEAGEAAVPEATAQVLANMENLAKAMEKLKEVADLGLDPTAVPKFNKGLVAMNDQLQVATKAYAKMGPGIQRKMVPALKEARAQVDSFTESGEEAGGVFKTLLQKILGPTRFMAIHRALGSLQEGLSGFKSAAQDVGEQVGVSGDKMESFNTNLNQVNLRLGLTRTELFAMGGRVLKLGAQWGIASGEMGEALEGLAQAGVPAGEELERLVPIVARIAQVTELSADQAAESAAKLSNQYKWSEELILARMLTMKKLQARGWVDINKLNEQGATLMNEAFLKTFATPEQQAAALGNLDRFTAALNSQWQATGTEFAELFGKAFTDIDVQTQLSALGIGFDKVQTAVRTGDFSEALEAMQRHLAGLTGPKRLQALAQFREITQFTGTSEELLNIATAGAATARMMDDLREETVGTAEAVELSGKVYEDAVGKWRTGLASLSAQTTKFGASWLEVFDVINPQLIISTGYLIKMGAEAVIGFGKAGKWLGVFGKSAKAATTATAAAAKSVAAPGGLTSAVGGLGKTIAAVGRGIGTFVKSVGVGIGKAIAGVFKGIAEGIMALIPALLALGAAMLTGVGAIGLAALVAALLAIAWAARIAAPALAVIGNVVMKLIGTIGDVYKHFISAVAGVMKDAIGGIVEIVKIMSTMKPSAMLALAGSMVILGPGFVALGAGILAMSVMLAAAAPGLTVFTGAMALLGGLAGTAGGMAGIIDGLVAGFAVDQAKLDAAVVAVDAAARFVVKFAAVSAALAGLSVGALGAKVVGKLLSFFGIGSPMEQVAEQSAVVSETLATLMENFGALASQVTASVDLAVLEDTLHAARLSISTLAAVAGHLTPLADVFSEVKASAASVVESAPAIVAAVRSVFEEAGEVMSLQQKFASPIVTPAEINRVVTVELDPSTTDKPVHEALQQTNTLLEKLILAVQTGAPTIRLAPAGAPARGVDRRTEDLATGRV